MMVVTYNILLNFNNRRYLYLKIIALIVLIFVTEPTSSLLPVLSRNHFHRVGISSDKAILFKSAISSLHDGDATAVSSFSVDEKIIDRRPHEQRTKGPRAARRMNHGFRYLYRTTSHLYENVTAFEYLTQLYSETEVMEMNRTFPPLLDLNVSRHVHPKIRFLQILKIRFLSYLQHLYTSCVRYLLAPEYICTEIWLIFSYLLYTLCQ